MNENHTIETFNGILKDIAIKESSKGKKYLSLAFQDENGKDVYMNSFSEKDLDLEHILRNDVLYKVKFYVDKGGYKKFLTATQIEGQHQIDDFKEKATKAKEEHKGEPDRKEAQIIRMSALKDAIDYYKVLAHTGKEEVVDMVAKLSPRDIEETTIEFERFIKEVLE